VSEQSPQEPANNDGSSPSDPPGGDVTPLAPSAAPTRRDRLERDLWIALFVCVLTITLRHLVDPDLGGHLAYGLDHYRTGQIADHDPYSYTAPGAPWINHEWAFEWLTAFVFTHFGSIGLSLIQVVWWGGAGGIVLLLVRRSSKDLLPAGLVYMLFSALIAGSMGIRPQLSTFLLFPVLLLLLETARTGRTWALAGIPPLFAVWVNLHGGFLAGLGVLGLYSAGLVGDWLLGRSPRGDQAQGPLRPRALALAACACVPVAVLATLANPYGVGLWQWLAGSLGKARPQISEWLPLEPDAKGVVYVALAVVALGPLLARERARIPLSHAIVLAVTVILGVRHVRHVPFFAMSAAAFAPGAVSEWWRRRAPRPDGEVTARQHRLVRAALAVVVLPFLFAHVGWPPGQALRLQISEEDTRSPFPTGALRYIEEQQVTGNMVVYFDWAQLVIYRYHPQIRVAYDGRFRTVYPPEVEDAYFDLLSNQRPEEWRRLLYDYPTEWVLIPVESDLADRMQSEAGWWLVYEDLLAALYQRAVQGEKAPQPVRRSEPAPDMPF
jgi:hypothetical protein